MDRRPWKRLTLSKAFHRIFEPYMMLIRLVYIIKLIKLDTKSDRIVITQTVRIATPEAITIRTKSFIQIV